MAIPQDWYYDLTLVFGICQRTTIMPPRLQGRRQIQKLAREILVHK
jgi:hypothetical protein